MKSLIGAVLDRLPVDYSRGDTIFQAPASTPSGMTADLGAMEAQATIFAMVDMNATTGAAVRWHLYRSASSGDPEDRTKVTGRHPAKDLWNRPNDYTTGAEFREATLQHYDLTGEFWWLPVRSVVAPSGPPVELWVVRPDRMRPVPSRDRFIAGYVYRQGQIEIPLRTDQVIMARRPNPLSPYRGLGPIGTLLLDIEGEKAATAFNTMFFRNGAEPGGLIEADFALSDPEWDQFQKRWSDAHRGVGNAHRVAMLEQGMKWVDRRYSARDMQFEQLRRFSRENFRTAFHFPKPLLGDVEDVNRANAEAADVVYAKYLQRPRLDRLREVANSDLLPMFGSMGEGYEFDYEDPTPPDEAEIRLDQMARVNQAIDLLAAGFDFDEVMSFLKLPFTTPAQIQQAAAEPPPRFEDQPVPGSNAATIRSDH